MPNINDFVVGLDPTSMTQITGAGLAQMVNGATPSSDRGLVLVSFDVAGSPNVPNASTTTEWQRFIWLRVSPTYVTAYVWNPGGATDVTYLNWVTISQASLAPGAIQGYQIANNTIPSTAIISLSSTQITGSVVAGWLAQLNLANTAYATNGLVNNNSPVFGVLSGTVTVPTFANNSIPAGAFTAQTIAGNATALTSPITDNSIVSRQLATSGATASTPLTNSAVDPANNIIVPTKSVEGIPGSGSLTQNVAAGDILAVAYGKQGYATVNRSILNLTDPVAATTTTQAPIIVGSSGVYSLSNIQGNAGVNTFGRILQSFVYTDNTPQADTASSGNVTCAFAILPKQSSTKNVVLLTALTPAKFTPISANSTIIVEACLYLCSNSSTTNITAALFQDSTVGAVACASGQGTIPIPMLIYFVLPSTSGLVASGTTFSLGFTGSALEVYYNNNSSGTTKPYNGLGINSWFRITEYI